MPDTLPKGFRVAGVHCGIKRNPQKQDVALVVSDRPATAAGVYTQNRVVAAPVELDRDRTPNAITRAVVINSGNANACTGPRGMSDAESMTALVGDVCDVKPSEVLVLSTGIIGEFLPMGKIEAGIRAAGGQLADDEAALIAAARGMMTTDKVHKVASQTVSIGDSTIQIAGMSKGAAMIGPNMATMLGLVLTDARLSVENAQRVLSSVVDETFNCIHVDGHTSTNDSVLLLANGAAGGDEVDGASLDQFRSALLDVCTRLARAIPADGEGATHLITVDVTGCQDATDARTIARTVADSPLVKTAVAGADPNWGRIVSAAGYAGVEFDPAELALKLNGCLLYEKGSPVEFDAAAVSSSIRDKRDTHIEIAFSAGNASSRFWTTDLTQEYVRLNADYHT